MVGLYTGTFNLDFNAEYQFYTSQILVQGYLNGFSMIAITGGLGPNYACATGNVYFVDGVFDEETGEVLGDKMQFIVCDACS